MTATQPRPGTSTAPSPPSDSADDATPGVQPAPARERATAGSISLQALALAGIFIAAFAFAAAAFAVGLAARALAEHDAMAAAGGTAVAAVPTIALSEFALTPDTVTVPAGTTKISVRNDGTVDHNLSIEGMTTATIGAGATTTLDIGGLAPGQHTMICAVPGHSSAGMTGTITIS
jgi:uncharacterized cupredoxin-like copper-binding protein